MGSWELVRTCTGLIINTRGKTGTKGMDAALDERTVGVEDIAQAGAMAPRVHKAEPSFRTRA